MPTANHQPTVNRCDISSGEGNVTRNTQGKLKKYNGSNCCQHIGATCLNRYVKTGYIDDQY